jgi:ribonuclease R
MMAHRLIFHYLNGGSSVDQEKYEELCKHSSEQEKRAADAERASIKYKQVEFMQNTIGQQFKGIVSGLTERGMYVEIEENKCEGMVRLSDMEDDFYELDAQNYRIIGRRNKRIISFGDEIWVEVKAANLNDRTIDLIFVDKEKEARGEAGSRPRSESRNRGSREKTAAGSKAPQGPGGSRNRGSRQNAELRNKEVEQAEAQAWEQAANAAGTQQEEAQVPQVKKNEPKGRNIKDYYGFDD